MRSSLRRLTAGILALVASVAVVTTLTAAPAHGDEPSGKVIDFSGARPGAGNIAARGYVGVIRYIGAPGDWRGLTTAELNGYRAAGLKVAVVYEEGDGSWARRGCAAGSGVGARARYYAGLIGWAGPVFLATDVDITPAQLGAAVDAYRCAREEMRGQEAGAYGGKYLLRGVRDQLSYHLLWSSNATSWDHGVSIPVSIQQWYSSRPPIPDTDENTVYGANWGQWPADTSPEAPKLASPEQVRVLLESWGFPCADWPHASTFWCVAAFQDRFQLNVDGVWGRETQDAATAWLRFLLAAPKAQTPEQAALAFLAACTTTSVVYGDTGPCVKLAQALLVHAGYSIEQSGTYSYETAGAVAVFEQDNTLSVDTAINPPVWRSLLK